jgi:hypothetical protein
MLSAALKPAGKSCLSEYATHPQSGGALPSRAVPIHERIYDYTASVTNSPRKTLSERWRMWQHWGYGNLGHDAHRDDVMYEV